MSDKFQFQMSEADVLKVIGEHVNRTLFKKPLLLTSISPLTGNLGFEFTAEPSTAEPRAPKARKAPKRGLGKPVRMEFAVDEKGNRTETTTYQNGDDTEQPA